MKFKELTKNQLAEIATRVRSSLGYMLQLKYGARRPSPELAEKIEVAAQDMGLKISRLQLLYPDESPPASPID